MPNPQRLPRFNRAKIRSLRLTERDRAIIRLVHHHRFLRSPQIIASIGGSSQQLLRRLQLLYHHGYLERPRAQIDTYHKRGSRHIAYGLGNKGAAIIRKEQGVLVRGISWGEKNRSVGRIFLEHALLVSKVIAAIELACRKHGIRLLTERELVRPRGKLPFRWKVKLRNGVRIGVVPDRVFALEFADSTGDLRRGVFFLEADRGTMPVKRRGLLQTSFHRKLLAYEATWSQSIHSKRFGFQRFRVVTVTTSAERVRSMVTACSQLKRGHGLFLLADRKVLDTPEDILGPVWQTSKPDESASLLN